MRNERKFEYQARKIKQLEEELKQEKSSATALESENRSIRRKYDAALETIERINTEHQSYVNSHTQAVAEAVDARKTYEALIAECLAVKSEYEKQITKLIGDAKRAGCHSNKQ